jgi:hypothetical protein
VGYGVCEVKRKDKCGSHTQQWLVRGGGEAYVEDKGPTLLQREKLRGSGGAYP